MSSSIAVERAKQVFHFLKAFAQKGAPTPRRVSEHHWAKWLSELPAYPTIDVAEVQLEASDLTDGTTSDAALDSALLTIRRPKTTSAPEPPDELLDFLQPGWRDPERSIEVVDARNVTRHGETITERFTDEPARVEVLAEWRAVWTTWAEAERPARQAMRVFERFYDLKGRIDRESERVELLLGDGRLRWTTPDGTVDHPILLQRVELIFDSNVPEFRVVDADREPELYGDVLVGTAGMVPAGLNELRLELERGGYHPLAREGTSAFLRRVVQTLAAGGTFEEVPEERVPTAKPVVSRDPVLFLRTRASGFPAAFDRVLEDLDKTGAVPTSLSRLVGVETQLPPDVERGEWSPWGEPPDILLSKPANEEQIRIARALDRHKAVLVQGPPGTGKSHTIGNLVGHLVAHGKRVLITSHTTKALRVLRGHIVESLRPLSVALLDDDLEGRAQMEEAVKAILTRLTNSTEESLERELAVVSERRGEINHAISKVTQDLRAVREAEYMPIVIAGEQTPPSEAARWVVANESDNTWIPGPVEQGAPLPLSLEELRALYDSNEQVTPEEESEIARGLPPIEIVPTPDSIRALFKALDASEPQELAPFWERAPSETELPVLERFRSESAAACEHVSHLERWQRTLVGIGHRGGSDVELWAQLSSLVADGDQRAQKANPQFLQHSPVLPNELPHDEAARIARELDDHLQAGGSLGGIGLLFHGEWKSFIRAAQCNGHSPNTLAEMRALRALADLKGARARLGARWTRQAEAIGLPPFASFGAEPEALMKEYTAQFAGLLVWWNAMWPGTLSGARESGFRWEEFRAREVARSDPTDPFERDVRILSGSLIEAVALRLGVCKRAAAVRLLNEIEETLSGYASERAAELTRAVRACDAVAYESAREALRDLITKIPVVERRHLLLEKLQTAAPSWATAIRSRLAGHFGGIPSDEAPEAWRWRQLAQEIERRAKLDEVALTRTLEQLRIDLRQATADVIDRRAWLGQIRRINLEARLALQGWAQIQKRIGKGTGKRVPMLRAEARGLLAKARDAVPVWIMPLNRVAESFDPAKGKFDVVIIDEASQSDVTGLLAWYLGDRVVVVGDHEQVSPTAVGEKIKDVEALISQHLVDIPNAVLYDGKQSVYELARASFGGTIALKEHFRCVPAIIDFSNYLSYNGDIEPLRDPTRVPLPHVVEHVVAGERSPNGKTNLAEARAIVAIMKALTELSRYTGASMGAISLLGDEQAALIQDLALETLGAVELAGRRFTAGNAAQFQGDERDVMFLSMVDSPTGQALRIRQDDTLKQRYNVAASRARDQLWLVHSLDPNRDLQAGDLRRRLIEHVRDPAARRGAIQRAQERAESPFESEVLKRLIAAGYRVEPQVWVGQYRIDIVVSDDEGQVAIECDGDRFHGVDQIPADMVRQAILERAGWRFVRIRGTRFYGHPDDTMRWVFSELDRLGVRPAMTSASTAGERGTASEFRDGVLRRAWQVMRERQWVPSVDVQEEMQAQ